MTRWYGAALALLMLALSAGCPSGGGEAVRKDDGPAPLAETNPEDEALLKKGRVWAPAIRSMALFRAFSDEVAGERFTKFLIDLKTKDIYYFDVNVHPMHTDFVYRVLYGREPTPDDLADFIQNYNEDKPRFLLCYLVHYLDQDLWTLSFYEGDRMRPEHIELAFEKMRPTFFAADRVKFRPDSTHHEEAAAKANVPVITTDEIYSSSTYQAFTEGKRVGILRVIDEDDDPAELTYEPHDILVLTVPIPTLTVVSGIVSEEYSTPLSHVALRARAWGIPHIGLKNAGEHFRPLEGKTVLLEARRNDYTLREAKPEEIAEWKASKALKRQVKLPAKDLKQRELRRLVTLSAKDVDAYGAKSSNLGQIAASKARGFQVPAGFGVPIVYYAEHLKRHGLDEKVEALLSDDKLREDAKYRKRKLAELREAIRKAPLDRKFLAAVWERVEELGGESVFVRSSTNAEDLPGFNGAGLYDTVPNVRGKQAVADAIKQVWASVWNLRAFDEREYYGIDHHGVYGAVLVQVAVPATAAGVLVTTNMFDTSERAVFTINAKSGLGIRVVDGHKVPEQLLVDTRTGVVKVLSRSDEDTKLVFDEAGGVKEVPVDKGEPVLTEARTKTLMKAAQHVVELFPKDAPQDIEWLFVGDALYIVQSRPYVTK